MIRSLRKQAAARCLVFQITAQSRVIRSTKITSLLPTKPDSKPQLYQKTEEEDKEPTVPQ